MAAGAVEVGVGLVAVAVATAPAVVGVGLGGSCVWVGCGVYSGVGLGSTTRGVADGSGPSSREIVSWCAKEYCRMSRVSVWTWNTSLYCDV